jgi:hypothetical protein
MKVAANGIDGRPTSGPSRPSAGGPRGASSESKTLVAIGHRVAGSPADKSPLPYSGGAVINPGKGSGALCSGGSLKTALAGASPVAASRGEAICIGLTEASGLRSVSPSGSAVFGLGFRIHERKKRSMIEGMRVLLKRGVASNNRMNLTRSAPQTDRRGPCRLSACSTG